MSVSQKRSWVGRPHFGHSAGSGSPSLRQGHNLNPSWVLCAKSESLIYLAPVNRDEWVMTLLVAVVLIAILYVLGLLEGRP